MPHIVLAMDSPLSDIQSVLTTELDINPIPSLYNPIFEEAHSLHPTVQEALFRHLEMSQRGFATLQENLHLYFSAIARSSPFNT